MNNKEEKSSQKQSQSNNEKVNNSKNINLSTPQKKISNEEFKQKMQAYQKKKIKKMNLSQMHEYFDSKGEIPVEKGPQYRIKFINQRLGINQKDYLPGMSPGQKYVQMTELSKRKQLEYFRDWKKDPVSAQIKRGRLGTDNFFIAFAVFGAVLIPLYFIQHFQKRKQIILKGRKVSPEVIRHLDEESSIQLEDVNEHIYPWHNPEKQQNLKNIRKKIDEMQTLERQLYD